MRSFILCRVVVMASVAAMLVGCANSGPKYVEPSAKEPTAVLKGTKGWVVTGVDNFSVSAPLSLSTTFGTIGGNEVRVTAGTHAVRLERDVQQAGGSGRYTRWVQVVCEAGHLYSIAPKGTAAALGMNAEIVLRDENTGKEMMLQPMLLTATATATTAPAAPQAK